MRMRVAAITGNSVDCLDLFRAELEEVLHRIRYDLVLPDAGTEGSIDPLVDGVDHSGGMLEERDLLCRLDGPSTHHDRLRVRRLDSLTLKRVQRLHVGQVDAERLGCQPTLVELAMDPRCECVRNAGLTRIHRELDERGLA